MDFFFQQKNEEEKPIPARICCTSKEREEFNEEECFSWLRREMNTYTYKKTKNTKPAIAAAATTAAVKAANEQNEIAREKTKEEKHAHDFEFSLNIFRFFCAVPKTWK